MIKRLKVSIAGLLACSMAAFALPSASGGNILKALKPQIPVAEHAAAIQSTVTPERDFQAEAMRDGSSLLDRFAVTRGEKVEFKLAEQPANALAIKPMGITGEEGEVTPLRIRSAAPQKAVKFNPGNFIANDLDFQNLNHVASMTITQGYGEGNYVINNIYNTGESVQMSIDADGNVTIPSVTLYTHPTYGDITLCPVRLTFDADGKLTNYRYQATGKVTGTVDDKGVITLASWGLIFTSDNDYKGNGINLFKSSSWAPAALNVTGYQNGTTPKAMNYGISIEQNSPTSATIVALSGVTGETLSARLTPDRKIVIAPQFVFNNPMYGDFFIYGATVGDDGKVYLNTTKLEGSVTSDNEINFGAWAICARTAPTQYVGYIFYDMKVTGPHGLVFPTAATLDFEGQGTAQAPYLIKSGDDIQKLASLVNGGNNFKDKYLKLTADLDLSAGHQTGYIPVGDKTSPFQGTFDGDNHTINGLKLDGMGFANVGIFGCIGEYGTVKNIKLKNARFYNVGDNLGGIAGLSYGTIDNCHLEACTFQSAGQILGGIVGLVQQVNLGTSDEPNYIPSKVTNCSFSGTLSGIGSVAGIVGQCRGEIANCHVQANLTHNGYLNSSARDVAGIAGVLSYGKASDCSVSGSIQDKAGMVYSGGLFARILNSTVERCFNTAPVMSTRRSTSSDAEDLYSGGIAGYTSNSKILNCFNSALVHRGVASENVGGIVGRLGVGYSSTSGSSTWDIKDLSEIRNCYNSGQVITPSYNTKKALYGSTYLYDGWKGEHPEDLCFFNSYYDKQINLYREDKYGRDTKYFTAGLPESYDASVWSSKTGCYPVLKGTAGTQVTAMASSALIIRDGQTASKVKGSFSVTPVENITWKISVDEGLADESASLQRSGNDFVVKDIYDTPLMVASAADGWSIKMTYVSVVPKLFDGEGTAESPYLLKTTSDWQTLAKAVGEAYQPHEDDFFAMTADADFTNVPDFKGVGNNGNSRVFFSGNVDGRNHFIKGLKLNFIDYNADGTASKYSKGFTGLFGYLGAKGSLRNITIDASCDFTHYTYGGTIAGINEGLIENCSNYATVKGASNYVGGIVGCQLAGQITKCYNAGKIISPSSYAAGIVGGVKEGSTVTLCQNDGDIIGQNFEGSGVNLYASCFGGISAIVYGNIDRCVNNGAIAASAYVGGIAAELDGLYSKTCSITNCINNGLVLATTTTATRGAITGYYRNSPPQTGNLYDSSINVYGSANNIALKTDIGLCTSELTNGKQPEGFIGGADFDFVAGKYPVLSIFKDREATKSLRAMFVAFQPKQVRTNINTDVDVIAPEGSSIKLLKNELMRLEGNKLKVTIPADLTMSKDTLTTVSGAYAKVLPLSTIPNILTGRGTAEEPYLIQTPADWNRVADFMFESEWEFSGANFKITNDLDFKGDSIHCMAIIGTSFQGILDGGKHTIKNYVYENNNPNAYSINPPNLYSGRLLGLIGTLGTLGEIKDITFDGKFTCYEQSSGVVFENFGKISGIIWKGTLTSNKAGNMAPIVWRNQPGGVVSNCVNEGNVVCGKSYAVGIAYYNEKDALIENCHNKGNLTVTEVGMYGICYQSDGIIRDCTNTGTFKSLNGGGMAAGIVSEMGEFASLENCHNKVPIDLGLNGGSIAGVVWKVANGSQGYIKNCSNTGNITGKADNYGFAYTLGSQLKVYDCFNTGDVTSFAGVACGFAGEIGAYGGGWENQAEVQRCYNTGFIFGTKQLTSGFAGRINRYTEVTDCYNFGDVISEGHTGLCTAGFASQISEARIRRCFNVGDVRSSGNSVGGIAGYLATTSTDPETFGLIEDCYNLGDVTSTYPANGSSGNGNAGGIVGYCSSGKVRIANTYNMGNVTATRLVGGIAGGAWNETAEFENIYNTGKVTCTTTDADGSKHWSGTIYSKGASIVKNFKNVYYDKTVNPGTEYRHLAGSDKTSAELKAVNFGDKFVSGDGYPVLKWFGEKFNTEDIAKSMLLLHANDTNFDQVKEPFTLLAPEGAVWKVTDAQTGAETTALKIEGSKATPMADTDVILTVTDSKKLQRKSFRLTLKASLSSIDDINAGKEVKAVTFFDLTGKVIDVPAPGQVYVVRTVFTDGSMSVDKKVIKD